MSIWSDIKKGLKAKKVTKQKKAGGVKTGVSKAPKYKGAPKAPKTSKLGKEAGAKRKKAATDKSWTKAVKAQKGKTSMNDLIKARNAAKASGDKSAYAAAQNQINKAYGSKKVHKAASPKKASPKKDSPKKLDVTDIVKNIAKSKPKAKIDVTDKVKEVDKKMSSERWDGMSSEERDGWKDRHRGGAKKMAQGGKVESSGGMFNWPSSDSRKR